VQIAEKQIAKGELVFTSFLFATSVVVLVDTTNMVESNAVGFVGPKVFAYMVGVLMFVLSAIQLIAVIRGERGIPEEIEAGVALDYPKWRAFAMVAASLVAYAALVELLGFLVMGPILYFAVAKAVGLKRNALLAFIAIVLSIVVYFGFTMGLQLYLPLGFDFIVDPSGQDSGW
jgi:putative tricarboxylic transport membrane protein